MKNFEKNGKTAISGHTFFPADALDGVARDGALDVQALAGHGDHVRHGANEGRPCAEEMQAVQCGAPFCSFSD